MLIQGQIPTQQLITRIYSANEAQAAFQHAAQPEALKVLLKFSE